MKKTLISLKSSKFEAFQKNELQTAMMQAVTGGEIYPNTTAGSSQTVKTFDTKGNETSCKKRYDTQTTDNLTLKRDYVWGEWLAC